MNKRTLKRLLRKCKDAYNFPKKIFNEAPIKINIIHYLSGFLVINTDQIRFYPEPSDHIFNEILPKPTYLFSGNCTNEYDDVTLFSDAAKTAIKKALDTGSKVISTCFIFKNLGPIFIGPAP